MTTVPVHEDHQVVGIPRILDARVPYVPGHHRGLLQHRVYLGHEDVRQQRTSGRRFLSPSGDASTSATFSHTARLHGRRTSPSGWRSPIGAGRADSMACWRLRPVRLCIGASMSLVCATTFGDGVQSRLPRRGDGDDTWHAISALAADISSPATIISPSSWSSCPGRGFASSGLCGNCWSGSASRRWVAPTHSRALPPAASS
jgi:hypothetical protein